MSNLSNLSNIRVRDTGDREMSKSETSNVQSLAPLPRARVTHE